MLEPARELYSFRMLLWSLVARDLRVRYKRSVLGVFWAFVEPLAMMGLFTLVFSLFLRVGISGYPVFALSGVIVWGFFQTGVTYALPAVMVNAALVKKIYFPREVLPIAVVLGRGVHFVLSLLLLTPFLFYFRIGASVALLWLPVLVVIQLVLVLGLALALGALATLYDDVAFLVNFVLSGLFYLSPVVYPITLVPEHLRGIYMLNPVACLLTAYRSVLMEQSAPATGSVAYAGVVALVLFLVGLVIFRRVAWRFAEVL